MKKTGILTFHRADNYGAVLQCYAMQEYLKKIGINAQVINYTNQRILNMYKPYVPFFKTFSAYKKSKMKFAFLRAAKTYCNNIYLWSNVKKHAAFKKFREKNLNLSEECETYADFLNITKSFDIIFVGSDQVWNKKMFGGEYDKAYFLDGVNPDTLKVSYAASAGDTIPPDDIDKIKNYLENFTYISTRESSLAQQLTDITGKDCLNVLDPVFLLSREEWKKLLLTPNPYKKERYILSYNISADTTTKEYMSLVDSVAEKLNLKVYEISKKKNSSKAGKVFSSVDPGEFLQLIDGADFVYTSSFHATVLSIILEKQFNVFIPKYATRVKNLLELLNLNHKMIYPKGVPEYSSVNYDEVKRKISQYLLKSEEFIKKSANK